MKETHNKGNKLSSNVPYMHRFVKVNYKNFSTHFDFPALTFYAIHFRLSQLPQYSCGGIQRQ